jgi:hypothetical protein
MAIDNQSVIPINLVHKLVQWQLAFSRYLAQPMPNQRLNEDRPSETFRANRADLL